MLGSSANCSLRTLKILGTMAIIIAGMFAAFYIGICINTGDRSTHEGLFAAKSGRRINRDKGYDSGPIIHLNLNDVQASTCANFSRFINFTSPEYQVIQ